MLEQILRSLYFAGHPVITGEFKSKVDRIRDTMWSGGISNPLSVIKRLACLLLIKRLNELYTLRENEVNRLERAHEASRKPDHRQIHPLEGAHQLGWRHRVAAFGKNLTDN